MSTSIENVDSGFCDDVEERVVDDAVVGFGVHRADSRGLADRGAEVSAPQFEFRRRSDLSFRPITRMLRPAAILGACAGHLVDHSWSLDRKRSFGGLCPY